MAADFKSHVLRRDEKGLFGIPFKRLLLAGCGGGMAYTFVNLIAPRWSIPVTLLFALSTLILTSPRGGIPLWGRLAYRLRGQLTLLAINHPNPITETFADVWNLSPSFVHLDSAVLFAPPQERGDVDLSEWVIFAHSDDADGLVFVDSPLQETS